MFAYFSGLLEFQPFAGSCGNGTVHTINGVCCGAILQTLSLSEDEMVSVGTTSGDDCCLPIQNGSIDIRHRLPFM